VEVLHARVPERQSHAAGRSRVIRREHMDPGDGDADIGRRVSLQDGLFHRTGALDTDRSGWGEHGQEPRPVPVGVEERLQGIQ
jgi:hypothetical protein